MIIDSNESCHAKEKRLELNPIGFAMQHVYVFKKETTPRKMLLIIDIDTHARIHSAGITKKRTCSDQSLMNKRRQSSDIVRPGTPVTGSSQGYRD